MATPWVVAYACDASTLEVETGAAGVQVYPQALEEFGCYKRLLCQKNKTIQKTPKNQNNNNPQNRAGGMTQVLRALAAFQRTWVRFPDPTL